MWTQISGRMPASSQASSELSTASFTVVSSALRGLSKPSRWRFLAKNSLTRNIALLGRHRLGRGPFPPPAAGVFLRRRTVSVWLRLSNFLYRWGAIFGVSVFEHRIVRVLGPLTDRRGFGRPRFLRLGANQVENPPHRSTRTARNSFPARAIRNQKQAVIKRGKLGELYRSHNVFHR